MGLYLPTLDNILVTFPELFSIIDFELFGHPLSSSSEHPSYIYKSPFPVLASVLCPL